MNRGHGVAHRDAQNAQNVQKWQKLGKMARNWENGQKIMKKKEKILDISLEINATILHTPACTQK